MYCSANDCYNCKSKQSTNTSIYGSRVLYRRMLPSPPHPDMYNQENVCCDRPDLGNKYTVDHTRFICSLGNRIPGILSFQSFFVSETMFLETLIWQWREMFPTQCVWSLFFSLFSIHTSGSCSLQRQLPQMPRKQGTLSSSTASSCCCVCSPTFIIS